MLNMLSVLWIRRWEFWMCMKVSIWDLVSLMQQGRGSPAPGVHEEEAELQKSTSADAWERFTLLSWLTAVSGCWFEGTRQVYAVTRPVDTLLFPPNFFGVANIPFEAKIPHNYSLSRQKVSDPFMAHTCAHVHKHHTQRHDREVMGHPEVKFMAVVQMLFP